MIKFALNVKKYDNYAFFCPVSKLHVTVSNPIGYTDKVTSAILSALKNKTILDVDNVVDIETGNIKTEQKQLDEEPKSKTDDVIKNEETTVDNTETNEVNNEIISEEKPKRGKRKLVAD